jgi:tellurite resistance protein TerC
MVLGLSDIHPWHWALFLTVITFFLSLDLGVFHKRAHVVKWGEAFAWYTFWVTLAVAFGLLVYKWRGKVEALEYITGYIVELSLSMDNVFVIAVIFSYFHVPLKYQHRVLFWGILGAIVMRGIMITVGVAVVQTFSWILYVFGLILVVTGIKMVTSGAEGPHPERNFALRLAQKFLPITKEFHGQQFLLRLNGKLYFTPLAIVLLTIETTDLVFALDSIPAIFGITHKPFIIFTSNVFAILGLRSLYFLLANAISYFRYLKIGLSLVLTFIGVKMLLDPHHAPPKWFQVEIPTATSLIIIITILTTSIIMSIVATLHEKHLKKRSQNQLNRIE